jgi:hypothetical protein
LEKTLRLIFRNEEGRQTTISVKDPVEPLNSADVDFAMDLILSSDIFMTSGGSLIEKIRAEVVGRQVDIILEF